MGRTAIACPVVHVRLGGQSVLETERSSAPGGGSVRRAGRGRGVGGFGRDREFV